MKSTVLFTKSATFHEKCHFYEKHCTFHEKCHFSKDHLQGIVTLFFLLLAPQQEQDKKVYQLRTPGDIRENNGVYCPGTDTFFLNWTQISRMH